jgi:glucose-1-phosphate thymidylyltransferase
MENSIKIVLPIAGLGTRLRPHTLFRPKPLISLAGKTILDFVLEKFSTIPKSVKVEYVFIVGNMGEQIKDYMDKYYPELNVVYFTQKEMRGQSDAMYIAREVISGPIIISFGDTINDPDFSTVLSSPNDDGIIWVKNVPDVSQMGVIKVDDQGYITHLFEKPKEFISDLALIGVYYFKQGEDLIDAIENQFKRDEKFKNEFYLADAINIMIENGAKIKSEVVRLWLDAGTIDTLLETNTYLLEHGRDNSMKIKNFPGVTIVPPVWIGENVELKNSVIGPNAVIEKNCKLDRVVISNSIIQEGATIRNMIFEKSMIGRGQNLEGQVTVVDNTSGDGFEKK